LNELKCLYTEVRPVAGRTQLPFLAKGVLIKSEKAATPDVSVQNKQRKDKTKTITRIEGEVSYLDFKVIDEKTFEIENLLH
jgi:hypothetical protein